MNQHSPLGVNEDYVSSQPPLGACTWCSLTTLCQSCSAGAVLVTSGAVIANRQAA